MAGIETVMSVTDRMSAPINRIDASINKMTDSMRTADTVSNDMLSVSNVNIGEFNQTIVQTQSNTEGLVNTLKKVASVASIIAGIRLAANWVKETFDLANEQLQAQVQLKTVLANAGAAEDAYERVIKKSQELQKTSIYGDEAYIAGAAELATYTSDTEALLTMMETLSNYATGMTGGSALDAKGMTDMATGLGKAMNGSYDALTKKGFKFSDAQKAVIEGTATQAQMVEAIGEEYANMTEEMMAAQVLSDAINESWTGLAENMANTPAGQVQQFANNWGDVKEVIGTELMPTVAEFYSTLNNNIDTIKSALKGVNYVLIAGMKLVVSLAKGIGEAATYAISKTDDVSERVQGVTAIFAVAGAFVINTVLGVVNGAIEIVANIWNFLASFANFIANFLNDPGAALAHLCVDLVDFIIGLFESLAGVIDTVFGLEIEKTLNDTRKSLQDMADTAFGKQEIDYRINPDDYKILADTRISYADAAMAGADWGRDLMNSYSSNDATLEDYLASIASSSAGTEANTSYAASITSETIAWLKDIAERDAINQFTTAAINVSLGGVTNNVSSGVQDLDGFVNQLAERIGEEIETTAAGYAGAY